VTRELSLKDLAQELSDPNIRKAIIYSKHGHKKGSVIAADFMPAAIVSTMTDGNFQQSFHNDETIDAQSGRPILECYPKGSVIVLVGGPITHDVINYYMNRAVGNKEQAPIRAMTYQHGQRVKFQRKQEVLVDMAVSELSKGKSDYGVIQTFEDGEKRKILAVTGFLWEGTWAASLWFRYKALKEGVGLAALVSWTDKNQNGLVELEEVAKIRDL
jgi:hypothetical protein